ncbi:MAG: DUF1810 domain-containing protein [Pseudoflavonifractor sp.]|nr:DUF1810 domain-containing protein [Alloprevotella sp.]MCM1116002.1 DUF1810 domain-containing protein [Pseudoflavonifractor sp.]
MTDRYYLSKFVDAQDMGLYEKALQEINGGRKMSHWMRLIFPLLRGFGHSHNTWFYGITCADKARAYLEHPILGPRLREISGALILLEETDPQRVMGNPDWLKLGSCMTLFDYVSPNDIYDRVLRKLYSGSHCPKRISMLLNSK